MAFGKAKEPKEAKKEKAPKAPKEKKPKKPKKEKPPKEKKAKPPRAKKGRKGKNVPEGVEGEEEQQSKKKLPLPFLLIGLAVIIAAAVIVFLFVIRPRLGADADEDPDATLSVEPEPQPPELPEKIPIGDDVEIKGMTLGADESGALVEKAKTVTYTYSNLVDAGKAAETYVAQLAQESPSFAVVDEEFVRLRDEPDYTTAEGMVLLARNVPVVAAAPEATPTPAPEPTADADADESAEPTPTPEPTPEPEPTPPPITYVHTVRISWAPGVCVVTADEQEGQVTSPPPATAASHAVTQRGAKQILKEMDPAQLELTGASMDEYEVMPVDGTEMVDDRPCIRLYVYSDNNQPNSNEIMGSYLMSIDGEHLYKVDPITDEIKELDYTP